MEWAILLLAVASLSDLTEVSERLAMSRWRRALTYPSGTSDSGADYDGDQVGDAC
jgi:hypothetical protein